MNRYQLYLDLQSVFVVDEIARDVDISRSKIIQLAVDDLEYLRLLYGAKSSKTPQGHRSTSEMTTSLSMGICPFLERLCQC